MSSLRFTEQALSDWMRSGGSHSEIVISSRMRIARNLEHLPFPMLASLEQSEEVLELLVHCVSWKLLPNSDLFN